MSFSTLKTLTFVAVISFVGCGDPTSNSGPQPQDRSTNAVLEMRKAMSSGDWKRADLFSQHALITKPNDPDLLSEVAKVLAMNERRREAALLLVEATTMANFQPESRVEFTVQTLIDVGELYVAIELLERALQANPANVKHRRQLIGFLVEAHRTQQIQPHLLELIRRRQFDMPLLLTVTETSSRRFLVNATEKLIQRKPDDRRVLIGVAYERFSEQDIEGAKNVLLEILAQHPDFAPALAMSGQVLVAQGRYNELADWMQLALPECKTYPEYWLALGDWANEQQKYAESCNAYWRAAQCNPNLGIAWSRLSQTLGSLADANSPLDSHVTENQLQDIGRRINMLVDLHCSFFDFNDKGRQSQSGAVKVAECLMNLGRNWEAEAWSAVATTLTQDPTKDLALLREEILNRLKLDASWQSAQGQLALSVNLDGLPAVVVSSQSSERNRFKVVSKPPTSDHLRLVAMSKDWGLESIGGENSPDEEGRAPLIYANGVGGGAVDYDLDGWPDLVVMGAGGTMLQTDSKPNELMRNLGTRFVNVTHETGIGDTGFGQGVAAGDFNEDGFSDLFFANLGKNRLLRNNGDGTFTDCTDLIDDRTAEWTTSASFFDMNADGITDLFVTNYCDAIPAVGDACLNNEGQPGPCHPLKFPANRDQVFVAQADGRLNDVSNEWIPQVSIGRGLGMIAGALDGSNMSVFIANDMSANHYYNFQDGENRLSETAALRGLAVDGRAMPQASMGIAASDFDNDGDLDLYVTGFAREYNIFYEQVSPGFWRDETSRLKLVEPTLATVGFGTQAIDLDNDGVDEIAVTNGHIGDFNDPKDPPYKQPLQIFRRDQQSAFRLIDDDSWGEYLYDSHVGRAMWLMDVNRDGLRDILITHTSEPICLLVNQTESDAHKIAFRLVGTSNSRDAVGTIIRFDCGGRSRALWSLAGDGYLCCNEKTLHAGLGDVERVDNVTVTWQNGRIDHLGSLKADSEYLIVEGAKEAFEHPTHFNRRLTPKF